MSIGHEVNREIDAVKDILDAVAEARAEQRKRDCAAMCPYCANAERYKPAAIRIFGVTSVWQHEGIWSHLFWDCRASAIHELYHQEKIAAQKALDSQK